MSGTFVHGRPSSAALALLLCRSGQRRMGRSAQPSQTGRRATASWRVAGRRGGCRWETLHKRTRQCGLAAPGWRRHLAVFGQTQPRRAGAGAVTCSKHERSTATSSPADPDHHLPGRQVRRPAAAQPYGAGAARAAGGRNLHRASVSGGKLAMLCRGSGLQLQAASQQQQASCIQPPQPHLNL